jgi:hypothetical protein
VEAGAPLAMPARSGPAGEYGSAMLRRVVRGSCSEATEQRDTGDCGGGTPVAGVLREPRQPPLVPRRFA